MSFLNDLPRKSIKKQYYPARNIAFLHDRLCLFRDRYVSFLPSTNTIYPFDKDQMETDGGFEKYTPDQMRLGCWSTTLAQIMYFHRLQPSGKVSYTSTKGHIIRKNLHIPAPPNELPLSLDSLTPAFLAEALARYNYYAALAIRKDFGTDHSMHSLAPANLLEQHYAVKVQRYLSWKRMFPSNLGKLSYIICGEINQNRPVLLHFSNLNGFVHSVVIDAFKIKENRLYVHLNQGQGGPQDGWYDFDQAILKEGDDQLRVIYTFRPQKQ